MTVGAYMLLLCIHNLCFFFNDTATTEIYTLSLHDALPILIGAAPSIANGVIGGIDHIPPVLLRAGRVLGARGDPKSTRLNSSHVRTSYVVFWLSKTTSICLAICPYRPS